MYILIVFDTFVSIRNNNCSRINNFSPFITHCIETTLNKIVKYKKKFKENFHIKRDWDERIVDVIYSILSWIVCAHTFQTRLFFKQGYIYTKWYTIFIQYSIYEDKMAVFWYNILHFISRTSYKVQFKTHDN